MHHSTFLIAALSASAHALPAADAEIGGDLSSNLNPGPHDPVSPTPMCLTTYSSTQGIPISLSL